MKNWWNNATGFSRILIIAGILVGGYFGVTALMKSGIIPTEDDNSLTTNEREDLISEGAKEVDICVVTWPGYIGGQWFNNGFKSNAGSRYLSEYNLIVNFHVVDDFDASRNGFKSGEYDLLWQTTGAFTTEIEGLKNAGIEPVVVLQADWSRGGDAIVARKGINSITDLVKGSGNGKYKVAVAPMTPSHTFLLKILEAEGKSIKDIDVIEVASAIDAADLFKAGESDASVVWSPDDIACVESQKGSSIIINTKTATNIIADIFYAKKEWVAENKETVQNLIKGWMIGAAEINENKNGVRAKAVTILAEGLNISEADADASLDNVRLCTLGDNLNFFGIDKSYTGVTGDDLYTSMGKTYNKIDYAPKTLPSWRTVTDMSLIKDIKLTGNMHLAEGGIKFTKATEEEAVAIAVTNKPISITFTTGSSTLDNNSKYIIDKEFVDVAKSFGKARIRVEGNTDNTGNYNKNKTLSEKRAQSVVDYLTTEYGFDSNRFIVVGNGSDNPVSSNDNVNGRSENRRTDFELLK